MAEEGVPPEPAPQPAAEEAGGGGGGEGETAGEELPAPLGSFRELCVRLDISHVQTNLAEVAKVTNEQQLMVLAELGLPEMDCQEIGLSFKQRTAILQWAKQEQRRKRNERVVRVHRREDLYTPEQLAETAAVERKAREARSLAASGFPWVDTRGEIQYKVTLWSYLYKEEAARINPRKSAADPAAAEERAALESAWQEVDSSRSGFLGESEVASVLQKMRMVRSPAFPADAFPPMVSRRRIRFWAPRGVPVTCHFPRSPLSTEIILLCQFVPQSATAQEIAAAMTGCDEDGHSRIDFREFVEWYREGAAAGRLSPLASEPEPEPEPEPELKLDGDESGGGDGGGSDGGDGGEEFGLRSWEAPNNSAMDEALAAAEAKKLAADLEQSALDQAAALMAARSGRSAPVPAAADADSPDEAAATDVAAAGLYSAPQEPAAAKEPAALDAAEADSTGADSTSPQAPTGDEDDTPFGSTLERVPSHVPSGRFGEGDWFCDARLRASTSSKESWAEFRKLVPEKMKGVQPLIEAWLVSKAEDKRLAAGTRTGSSVPALASSCHPVCVATYV
jgi:hypothetical protein